MITRIPALRHRSMALWDLAPDRVIEADEAGQDQALFEPILFLAIRHLAVGQRQDPQAHLCHLLLCAQHQRTAFGRQRPDAVRTLHPIAEGEDRLERPLGVEDQAERGLMQGRESLAERVEGNLVPPRVVQAAGDDPPRQLHEGDLGGITQELARASRGLEVVAEPRPLEEGAPGPAEVRQE